MSKYNGLRYMSVLILFSLINLSSVFALQAWTGKRFIYSVNGKNNVFMQIEILDNLNGTVTTSAGQANFTYTVTDDKKINMTVTTPLSYDGYVTAVHDKACKAAQEDPSAIACQPQPFKAASHLKYMTLLGDESSVKIEETWELCTFYDHHTIPTYKTCEKNNSTYDSWLALKDKIDVQPLNFISGDKIFATLPHGSGSAYLQLNGDHSVTILTNTYQEKKYTLPGTLDATTISKWNVNVDGKLTLTTTTGDSISYQKIQNYDGVSRVLAFYETQAGEKEVFAGALTLDEQLDLSNSTVSQFSGTYRLFSQNTISVGYANSDQVFQADGFGYKSSQTSTSVEPQERVFAWQLNESGEFVTKVYRPMNGAVSEIKTKLDLQNCVESLEQATPLCQKFLVTTYKIISQDGNRYTMLKMSDYHYGFQANSDTPNRRFLSVSVFYKK